MKNTNQPKQNHGISRRHLLEVTTKGTIAVSVLGANSFISSEAKAADPFVWISPRGTVEVLDTGSQNTWGILEMWRRNWNLALLMGQQQLNLSL